MTAALAGLATRLRGSNGVLVDSNILLDVATNDPVWSTWSADALAECPEHAQLLIDPIIYAEVSIGFTTIEALDAALPNSVFQRAPLPWRPAFSPGRAFWPTAREVAPAPHRCRISTSGHMQR
jgi:hypothetical protein